MSDTSGVFDVSSDDEDYFGWILMYTLYERGPPGFRCHDNTDCYEKFKTKVECEDHLEKLTEKYDGNNYREIRLEKFKIVTRGEFYILTNYIQS